MAKSSRFHLGDILSVTSGIIISPKGEKAVQELLSFMKGEEVGTSESELRQAMKECHNSLLIQCPKLRKLDPSMIDGTMIPSWLKHQIREHGDYHSIRPLQRKQQQAISPAPTKDTKEDQQIISSPLVRNSVSAETSQSL